MRNALWGWKWLFGRIGGDEVLGDVSTGWKPYFLLQLGTNANECERALKFRALNHPYPPRRGGLVPELVPRKTNSLVPALVQLVPLVPICKIRLILSLENHSSSGRSPSHQNTAPTPGLSVIFTRPSWAAR